MFVNLHLIDGSVIRYVTLFPEDVSPGDHPYVTKDAIDRAISKVPWGEKFVCYQSKVISGRVHVNSIEKYKVV